jgi:hypothetical protein
MWTNFGASGSGSSRSGSSRSQFCGRTRREFIWETGAGFTGLALSSLLARDGFFPAANAAASGQPPLASPLAMKPPHHPTKAKACIFLYMYGGPSQMDLFDYKPELQKRDGEELSIEIRRRSIQKQKILGSKRKFKQHGESGLWCSDAFPHIAKHMDEMAVIKSLYADSFAHGSANLQMNTGRILQGYPSLGSWLGYGLGSQNENLPAFVVMLDPRGGPIPGAANWASGFMPAAYQGTVFRSTGEPILALDAPSGVSRVMQRDTVDTLAALNRVHAADRPGMSELDARIASYELAFQLQSSAPELLDLSDEDDRTLESYGLYDKKGDHPLTIGPATFGRQCLVARRLVERGVRFVQIYSGGGHQQQNWDAHQGMEANLAIHCPEVDKPIGALLGDLKARGLLDSTLIVWGGEFGRQPVSQGGSGRDHNPKGFTYWLAGGGVKKGISYGETDDLGHEAVVDRHHVRDLHATILHLMGLEHEKLSFFFNGLDQKLTGVQPAHPITGVIA